jgi:potassium uptake TrkH family protein
MINLTWIAESQERRESFYNGPLRFLRIIPFLVSVLALGLIIYDLGFNQEKEIQALIKHTYVIFNGLAVAFLLTRQLLFYQPNLFKVWLFDSLFAVASLITIVVLLGWISIPILHSTHWLFVLFMVGFLREFSALKIEFRRSTVSPAMLFLLSFLVIILVGAGFLMFPTATVSGISFIDALFTSTSAVCVTGLVIAETATYFTPIGQLIILFLIQVGGLGIMTFTSYFSYYFRGESSYENQLMIQEMTGTNKIVEVFGALKRVLLLTFIIEGLGALILYVSLSGNAISDVGDKVNFAIFHAISAFCNAGFSIVENNLANPFLVHEYDIQLTIGFLIIFGGLGFPILYNFWTYFKQVIIGHYVLRKNAHSVWIINLNTRIIGLTTICLLLFGTIGYYVMEYDNVLKDFDGIGKWVTAFFASVTARTAGFNTIDYAQLTFPALILSYFLMWVGASPASTGGGIKTSTFAISVLNSFSIAKGKKHIEAFGREITDITVKRAYSQLFLSILAIGISITLVSWFDPLVPLRSVIFECISAFGTVGLSMGITADLSPASKFVLVLTMYVGRVNLLTLMAALVRQVRYRYYRFPSEDIPIN